NPLGGRLIWHPWCTSPLRDPTRRRQMSDYAESKACQMLDKKCAVCATPLLDAHSVEVGIGPTCREKYGYNIEVDAAARSEANRLVNLIAERQEGLDVAKACERLRELGFHTLAARVLE